MICDKTHILTKFKCSLSSVLTTTLQHNPFFSHDVDEENEYYYFFVSRDIKLFVVRGA
jgi:hypothetical protein